MADIRIKDLATTAASTASDDFVAVDGSANGTRKLNAYSPTFGGSLTATGGLVTGGSPTGYDGGEIISSVTTNGSTFGIASSMGTSGVISFDHRATGNTGSWRFRNGTGAANTQATISSGGNATFAGNLTVSGTGNNILNASGGNLLLGTTTDTGYKLYVKGASDAQAMLDVASGSQYTSLAFANNGTGKGFVYWDNSNNALFTGTYASSAALKFNTGLGVLALTLDSSQNATFAGEVKAATQMYAEKTGAGVYGRSVGMIQQHTTVNSTTYNVTTASAKVFVISLGSGDAALCYASYKSSTITILGSDGTIVNSSTPASGELGIYKSANDHVISFKTGSAAASNYGSWGFCFVGNPVQSIT